MCIEFIHHGTASELQGFFDSVKYSGMLNSHDNEEGWMIDIEDFQYRTDPA